MKVVTPRIGRVEQRRLKPAAKKADPFYQSREWRELVARLIAERGRRCQECGASSGRIYADHVMELRDGGAPLDPTNIRLLCAACHAAKTSIAMKARAGVSPSEGSKG